MLVFDALIYNEDRHFGNFGLLRNNHTGEIIAPAPIFDNGLSLFNYAMPDDFKNLSAYAKTRSNPYRISYEDVCKEVMGAKQKAQLRRMVDLSSPVIRPQLLEQRLTVIEKQLVERNESCSPFRVQRSTKANEPEKMIRLRYGSIPIPQIHTANLTVEKVTISSYNMLKSE